MGRHELLVCPDGDGLGVRYGAGVVDRWVADDHVDEVDSVPIFASVDP